MRNKSNGVRSLRFMQYIVVVGHVHSVHVSPRSSVHLITRLSHWRVCPSVIHQSLSLCLSVCLSVCISLSGCTSLCRAVTSCFKRCPLQRLQTTTATVSDIHYQCVGARILEQLGWACSKAYSSMVILTIMPDILFMFWIVECSAEK